MEQKLKNLFDFQKFEKNSRLQKIIDDSINRYESFELSDDDLSFVNAAGTAVPRKKNDKTDS